jgi:hypothetical protein
MLADHDSPSHAASLAESLSYASTYADAISRMLAEGNPDPDKAAHLVQGIRNMLCVAEDELDALDDTQQVMDAVATIRGLDDPHLFSAITDTPTYGNP